MTEDLPALWKKQQDAVFPLSCAAVSLEGVTLLKLDVEMGRILTAILKSDGVPRPVSDEDRRVLEHGGRLIARALAEEELDAPSRAYFERLAKLATLI